MPEGPAMALRPKLTADQFKRAIKSLGLSWADNNSTLNMVFLSLDQDHDRSLRGTLGLDEIALGVLDCVSKPLLDYENDYLEQTYQHLMSNGRFKNLKDTMVFLNFNRDYSCTPAQFIQMFRSNFEIGEGVLQDYQVNILMQKYIVKLIDQSAQQKSGGDQASTQRVFYFRMFHQLACRNKGCRFHELPHLKIAETI